MRRRRILSIISESLAWLLLAAAVLGTIVVIYYMAQARSHRGRL